MNINKLIPVLVLLLVITPVSAYDIAGISLPDKQLVEPSAPELSLNGAGVRSKLFFDIYVAGLYLTQPLDSLEAIEQEKGAKRVLMHFLYKEVSKEKLNAAWWEGFENNLSNEAFNALKPQIETFTGFFQDTHKGDVVWLDYIPGSGTRISLNGRPIGSIPGETFYPALLRIWLGDKPVTSGLKKGMLGID